MCADPYENGTPTWGSDGTPKHLEKKGSKLSCSFDDSVEWLRPKQEAVSKTRGDQAEEVAGGLQLQTSSASSWCPFAKSRKAESQVAANR